jgi:hypothetical protein
MISERNSGMANLVTPKLVRSEDVDVNGKAMRRSHLELPVTPGPYHMIPRAGAAVPYLLKIELVDASGNPGAVTRHGIAWIRMCEG